MTTPSTQIQPVKKDREKPAPKMAVPLSKKSAFRRRAKIHSSAKKSGEKTR